MSTDPDAVDALRRNLHEAQQRIVELEAQLKPHKLLLMQSLFRAMMYCGDPVQLKRSSDLVKSTCEQYAEDYMKCLAAVAAQPRQEGVQ